MDDLGWADLTCYGSSFYETSQLDRLAAEGAEVVLVARRARAVLGEGARGDREGDEGDGERTLHGASSLSQPRYASEPPVMGSAIVSGTV